MTKESAQELIQIMKEIIETGVYKLPAIGTQNKIPLQSVLSKRDKFDVIVNRIARIKPSKYTLVLHYPEEGLLRIDVDGPDHINPDGTRIPCPHLHMRIKDTGQWDNWAMDLPAVFGNTEDCAITVRDFLQYCQVNNIQELTICEQGEIQENVSKAD